VAGIATYCCGRFITFVPCKHCSRPMLRASISCAGLTTYRPAGLTYGIRIWALSVAMICESSCRRSHRSFCALSRTPLSFAASQFPAPCIWNTATVDIRLRPYPVLLAGESASIYAMASNPRRHAGKSLWVCASLRCLFLANTCKHVVVLKTGCTRTYSDISQCHYTRTEPRPSVTIA